MPRFAVNICDLSYPEISLPAQLLVGPVCPEPREIVQVDPRLPDTGAVVLQCEETRAEAICDTLQTSARLHRRILRTYVEGPRGGWKQRQRS